jgi:hypothetical protein
MPGNLKPDLPVFAFATITAANCRTAAKEGKREASKNLGIETKHVKCR